MADTTYHPDTHPSMYVLGDRPSADWTEATVADLAEGDRFVFRYSTWAVRFTARGSKAIPVTDTTEGLLVAPPTPTERDRSRRTVRFLSPQGEARQAADRTATVRDLSLEATLAIWRKPA